MEFWSEGAPDDRFGDAGDDLELIRMSTVAVPAAAALPSRSTVPAAAASVERQHLITEDETDS